MAATSTSAKPPPPSDWIARIESEILAGMPNEQARRLQSLTNVKYYRLRGKEDIPRREGEEYRDYDDRPKVTLPFTRRVVNVLASKLYAHGPSREIVGDPKATEWLQSVYHDCRMDARWMRADRYSHLQGMCAIQVAATGDRAHPIKMHLWSGWHEVVPFEAPGQANEVAACVTIDCVDSQTTYTLWTIDAYRTYRTKKLAPGQTSGGRVAEYVPEESGPNPYGCLPFAFVWFEPLDGGVDEQQGLGAFLSSLNAAIDVIMSDEAQAMKLHHVPTPVAYNVDVDALQLRRINGFMHVPPVVAGESPNAPEARLDFLQPRLDVAGGCAYIRNLIDSELEALGMPLTAYRLDQGTLPSGAALIMEQAPLIEYANERRVGFLQAETDLARICLTVAGSYYVDAALLACADGLELSLTWPPITINLPSTDRDEQDLNSLAAGFESRVMVVMRRFGLTREQALRHLKQVVEDEEALAGLGLAPIPLKPGQAQQRPSTEGPAAHDETNVQTDLDDLDESDGD